MPGTQKSRKRKAVTRDVPGLSESDSDDEFESGLLEGILSYSDSDSEGKEDDESVEGEDDSSEEISSGETPSGDTDDEAEYSKRIGPTVAIPNLEDLNSSKLNGGSADSLGANKAEKDVNE